MTTIELKPIDDFELQFFDSDTAGSSCQFPCKHARDDESCYPPGSEEYKKARKRRQNRESAVRIRNRKKLEECYVVNTLDNLRENTGKLRIENEQLKSENEILRRQIALFKKLAEDKTGGEVKIPEKDSIESKGVEVNHSPKGKKFAGFGLFIAIACMLAVFNAEETQQINTGGRSLAFSDSNIGIKPIIISALVIFSGLLANFIFAH